MFTPLKDTDVWVMLPFLDHMDIHCVIQTNKGVYKEFYERLLFLKRFTFRSIEHLHVSEFDHIKYAMCVDEKREGKQEIQMVEICRDTLGCCFLKLHHSNGTTQTIIYHREFKFQGDDTLLYRIDKRCLETS